MQTTINNFLEDLSKNPRWTHFKTEFRRKLHSELTKLKGSIGQSTWQTAEKNYNKIIKKITVAQKQMDQEVQKTLKSIKKSALDMEKTINQYKAMAMKQKASVKRTKTVKRAKKVSKAPSVRKKTAKI